jgi:outer membrane protein
MKMILLRLFLYLGFVPATGAQDSLLTMDECIRYALKNSTEVKKRLYEYDSHTADYAATAAAFLPSIAANVSAQYSFGRAIDPETNTYVHTTTFNNYYSLSASLPVFDGGQVVNRFRAAKVNRQIGMDDLQQTKDDLALNTMEAFVNVVYCQGAVCFAREKRDESLRTLYKVRRQEELGLKGRGDVAQVEAQAAGDDFVLTQQQNRYEAATLRLKELMNFPYGKTLATDTALSRMRDFRMLRTESVEEVFEYAKVRHPAALMAAGQLKVRQLSHLIRKGARLPSVTVSAGVNTSYYDNLKSEGRAPSTFHSQFANNRGEYVSLNLNLPLFNRLSRIREVRRARNEVGIARVQQQETLRRLRTAIEQAVLERDGYARECVMLEKKLASDRIAYQMTLRMFEEGLMSPIELQTSANTLVESKAKLLHRQLMYLLRCRQVDYYNGNALVEEGE